MRLKMNLMFAMSIAVVAAVVCSTFTSQARAAEFTFQANNGGGTSFEQRWNQSANWLYVSGVDDGTAGIPDGTDTFTIDRNGQGSANNTDLSNEGMPNNHTVAKIKGTGAPGRDIVLKTANVVIGDLEVLASSSTFEIFAERDRLVTINGIISGAGNLDLKRNGGFTPDVIPGEDITITGTAGVNTITGEINLINTNGSTTNPQPGFWVADKVGAFGQSSKVTLAATGSGLAELKLTANTVGGEGAIDDDATELALGKLAILNVDAGVDEFIASGKLSIDLAGTGTFSVVPDGIYTSSNAAWITGDGTVTVGIPEPASMALIGLGGLMLLRRRRA